MMHVGNYLTLLHDSEQQLIDGLLQVANHHGDEPDVEETCELLASWSQKNLQQLKPLVDRYAEDKNEEPERLLQDLFQKPRTGSLALMRDLQDIWLIANQVQLCWAVLDQAAKALRDRQLQAVCNDCSAQTKRQVNWLFQRIRQAAPQALVVAA
jgi:hypothetical protein